MRRNAARGDFRRGALAGAVAILTGLVLTGCSSRTAPAAAPAASASDAGYGALPSFLPSTDLQADSVLNGSAAYPALTTEGDSVRVRLGDSSVLATVSGPEVPGEGLPFQADNTTCTWVVTLSGASNTIPIAVRDFTTIDHLGHVYRLSVVPGQHRPPATISANSVVTFELRTVMATGEGLMRWAPQGHETVASWDFEVEND